jgi:hypothetical protein
MSMARLAVMLAGLLLAGCSHDDGPSSGRTSTLLSLEPAGLGEAPTGDECFAAARGIVILAEAKGGPPACERLAARYLKGAQRIPWPPPLLRNPDGITACFLGRRAEQVAVQRSEAEPDIALAEHICAGLRREGWKRASLGPG